MRMLGMDEMQEDFTYLGNPMSALRSSTTKYSFLVERTQRKLKGWKQKMLSHVGREVLIKSTLSSLPSYFMSTACIPSWVLKKLSAISRDFWWGFNLDRHHLYLKSWSSFCKPKMCGGLGFRDLNIMNWVFILKLAWQLLTVKNKWWVACLSTKYLKNEDLWNTTSCGYQSKPWRSILSTISWLRSGTARRIGNGCTTLVYGEQWVPTMGYPL